MLENTPPDADEQTDAEYSSHRGPEPVVQGSKKLYTGFTFRLASLSRSGEGCAVSVGNVLRYPLPAESTIGELSDHKQSTEEKRRE